MVDETAGSDASSSGHERTVGHPTLEIAMRGPPILAVIVILAPTLPTAIAHFQPGEFYTYSQHSWGGNPATSESAALLSSRFYFVYPSGGVGIGVQGGDGFSLLFTSAGAIRDYLPAIGPNAPLSAVLLDPTSTSSGNFGGQALALRLNVDFCDAGDLPASRGTRFGDLTLVNMEDVILTPASQSPSDLSGFNGLTVRDLMDEVNVALATGASRYNFEQMAQLTEQVALAFEGSIPSQFAQSHLRFPPPGDFDKDGDADGADFLKWQRALGSADPTVDANVDGIVDAKDLAIWASSFGAAAATTWVAVPEPTARFLSHLGVLAAILVRRRCKGAAARAVPGHGHRVVVPSSALKK